MFKFVTTLAILFLFLSKSYSQDLEGYWIDKYYSVSFPLKSIKTTSAFGIRKDPFNKTSRIHYGLDLRARYEEVLSMFDGYVKAVGQDARSGIFIKMQFGDYTISYCHLSKVWVRTGDAIYAGDPVGITGSTGRSTAPHLHITAKLRGQIVDPTRLLEYIRDTKQQALAALQVNDNAILSPSRFIKKYAPIAMEQQRKYGIPSSVILAQMCLESTYGTSPLAISGNNFFGIKASHAWVSQGLPYSYHDDDRKNEKFCNYSSPRESIEHHTRLLLSNRYRECFRYGPTDYHHWLVSIKKAGYATASNYVAKCEAVINKYKLYLYDMAAQRG